VHDDRKLLIELCHAARAVANATLRDSRLDLNAYSDDSDDLTQDCEVDASVVSGTQGVSFTLRAFDEMGRY
jgi:hypothetical protein